MKIEIPADAEALLLSRANQAGFDNVSDYVLNLAARDTPADPFASALEQNKDHVETLIDQSYASGPLTPLTKEDFSAARDRLQSHVAEGKRNQQ